MTRKPKTDQRPLSLSPLSFDEAVSDLLKIGPMPKEPKPPKKKRTAKKSAKTSGSGRGPNRD